MRTLLLLASLIIMPQISAEDGKVLKHVVLFKFKAESTAAQIDNVVKEFAALPGKIDAITGFEWGKDVSVESRAKGFTHAFVVKFKNQAGIDAYLPHPAHKAFVGVLKPHLEDVLVFDYWADE